jgi:hypothetical protein
MGPLVTSYAKGHQIIPGIMSEVTPCLDVMYLKVLHSSTLLAAPSVSLENRQAQLTVGFWIKPQSRPLHLHFVAVSHLRVRETLSAVGGEDNQPTEVWNEVDYLGCRSPS